MRFLLGVLFAFVSLAFAAQLLAKPKKEGEVRVLRQFEPRYPLWAYNHGVSKGFARVAFYVGEDGEISELLPIEYSHAVFGEELMSSVLKWKFQAAERDGKPFQSVCHAYWEFLPDRPIETNALFDTAKRMNVAGRDSARELKYRKGKELDRKVGMLSFPGLLVSLGDSSVEAGLEQVRARVSFFVTERGEVALPYVVDSSYPDLDDRLEIGLKQAGFAIPTFKGKPTIALLERTYDFPIVWVEGPVVESLD